MGFFTLKSSHTLFLIIFGLMLGAFATYNFYPEYFQYSAYGAVFGILFLVFGLYLNAIIQGPRYPHIEHTIRHYPTGIALAIKDFYIDTVDPVRKVPDVFSMMEKDEKGRDIPYWLADRWFYPYLVRTHWGVDIGEFEGVELHIFVLPYPWDVFLKFARRPDGAYLMGEVYSHGSSEHLESYLAPFTFDYLGMQIPIYAGVAATHTYRAVTRDWRPAMNEFARFIPQMDALIEQESPNIFPMKELEEMALTVLPAQAQNIVKKKLANSLRA